jgi:hypothetical protein
MHAVKRLSSIVLEDKGNSQSGKDERKYNDGSNVYGTPFE